MSIISVPPKLAASRPTPAGGEGLRKKFGSWRKALRDRRRRQRFRRALSFCRLQIGRWRSAYSISAEDRQRLAGRFRRSCYAVYGKQFAFDRFRELVLLASPTLMMLYVGQVVERYGIASYAVRLGTLTSLVEWMGALAFVMAGAAAIITYPVLLISLPLYYMRVRWAVGVLRAFLDDRKIKWTIFAWVPLTLIFFHGFVSDPLNAMLLSALGLFILLLGVIILAVLVLITLIYWLKTQYPDDAIAVQLVDAMKRLEDADEKWTDIDRRAHIAKGFAAASTIARRFLFRKFGVESPWATQRANSIAAALSEKQAWLMTPKPDTRDILLEHLSRSIVVVLSGTWDQLELGEVEREQVMTRFQRAIGLMLRILRTFFVAVSPTILSWIARERGLFSAVENKTLDYLVIGLFVWAVLILIWMLDPQIKEKIATLGDVTRMLSPSRKKD
jgi:hypothetical protein